METKFVENSLFSQNIVYCTALYLAAQNGHKDIVKYISELPIDTVGRGLSEFTKIFLGAQNGRFDAVKETIESMFADNEDDYGDDTRVEESDEEGEVDVSSCSTIHEAAEYGAENLIRSFIETGAEIDLEDTEGYTPLQIASKNGKVKCIEVLISEGAPVDHKIKENNVVEVNRGKTALHIACEHGRFGSVSKLLSYGADPEVKDFLGNVPLYYAAKYGSKNIVELLLKKGVNINAANNNGQTVISEVCNENIINILLRNGLNCTNSGMSILHNAAFYNNDVLANFILKNKTRINIEHRGNLGNSPLSSTACFNTCNVMKVLLKYGANINSINNDGQTPLHRAALQGSTEAVKLLIENGADINSKVIISKETPLILAAMKNNLDIIKLLLSNGADVKIKDSKNKSALDYAIANNNQEIILMLRKFYTK